MLVWFLMLISIVAIRFLIPDALGEKKKNFIFLSLAFGIIVLVVGSRSPHMSGSYDLYNYFKWYGRAMIRTFPQLLENAPMESGYLIFNKILAWLVPWNYFIIYFEAAFTTGVMFWYIYRNADSVYLAVIVYICLGPWQFFLTGFRQSFAIALCFIAYELLKKQTLRRDVAGVLIILFATSMHTTAWVFLSVLIIRRLKLTKRLVLYFSLLTLILFFSLEPLLKLANDTLGRSYTEFYNGNPFGGIVPIAVYAGTFLILFLLWREDKNLIDDNMRIETVMLLTGFCIYCLRYNLQLMERVSFYFTPTVTIVLTNAITRQKDKKVRNITLIVCILLCIALFAYRSFAQLGVYHPFWEYLERSIVP